MNQLYAKTVRMLKEHSNEYLIYKNTTFLSLMLNGYDFAVATAAKKNKLIYDVKVAIRPLLPKRLHKNMKIKHLVFHCYLDEQAYLLIPKRKLTVTQTNRTDLYYLYITHNQDIRPANESVVHAATL